MLLSASNRKYQSYPLLSYFPWLCAWDVWYIIFRHLLHIHSGQTGILFSLLLCCLWWVKIVGCVLACRSWCVYNIISLSSLCKLICGHRTYKMPVRYILSSVWVRLSIFSQLSIIQYMGLCILDYPSPLWWLRECIIHLVIIINSEIWTITHCLGLGHETMVCAVCLSIFFNDIVRLSKTYSPSLRQK